MNAMPLVAEILGPDIVIILVIVAVLFGSSRLPKLARSLGSAKSEFEKGIAEGASGAPKKTEVRDEQVTMTKAELDSMIAEREAQGRSGGPTSAPPQSGPTALETSTG